MKWQSWGQCNIYKFLFAGEIAGKLAVFAETILGAAGVRW